jgi:competence ComEA-like helix-hairpin-helix protein
MGLFTFVHQKLGFTKNEINVILFLILTFLGGLAVRWYQESAAPDERFDYSDQDRVFIERSRTLLSQAGENPAQGTGSAPAPKKAGTPLPKSISLNTASADELVLLPGIGRTYAERIVQYRREHGPFHSIDELTRVKGIGKKTLDRIRVYLDLSDKHPTDVAP